MTDGYQAPTIEDYGTLEALTQATAFTDAEDGGNKSSVHHSGPPII